MLISLAKALAKAKARPAKVGSHRSGVVAGGEVGSVVASEGGAGTAVASEGTGVAAAASAGGARAGIASVVEVAAKKTGARVAAEKERKKIVAAGLQLAAGVAAKTKERVAAGVAAKTKKRVVAERERKKRVVAGAPSRRNEKESASALAIMCTFACPTVRARRGNGVDSRRMQL